MKTESFQMNGNHLSRKYLIKNYRKCDDECKETISEV